MSLGLKVIVKTEWRIDMTDSITFSTIAIHDW